MKKGTRSKCMRKILSIVVGAAIIFSAPSTASIKEEITAAFAAKYIVCGNRLSETKGYRIKAARMKSYGEDMVKREGIGDGFIVSLVSAKEKARNIPLLKCKKIAIRF